MPPGAFNGIHINSFPSSLTMPGIHPPNRSLAPSSSD